MAQETFQRYEKKYRLTPGQYQELMGRMITKLIPDRYGKYTICNIYLDTEDYRLIRTSLEKPDYKEKLRLRSYGTPGDEDVVFLELKKKFHGVVYKRRVEMTMQQARSYLYDGRRPKNDSQIMREIDYSVRHYGAYPRVYLSYDRIAFGGKEDPGLRVTFDMNIRARDYHLDLGQGPYGMLLMRNKDLLMEVKIPGAMPLWMSHLFSELGIFPVSFSKYGAYYAKKFVPSQLQTSAGGRQSAYILKGGMACA